MSGRLERYHEHLFRWHCEQFFPFDKQLTKAELSYLRACFQLAEDYVEPTPTGYRQLSYYSYSHRVDGAKVNSSRIAMGSLAHPDEAWAAAGDVMGERKIDARAIWPDGAKFYGLGWDLLASDFKLYLWVPDVHRLPERLSVLARPHAQNVRAEGLISFTYTDGQVTEEKVYLYPNELTELGHRTLMVTTGRGVVGQHDVDGQLDKWLPKLNRAGHVIVARYQTIDEPLDTIAYADKDHYTLYFP